MDHETLFEKTPPTKLFLTVTIPGVISMLVMSLYQVIDGAFVGHLLGAEAFAALNLVMPLVIINFSVADLIGVGSSVPIAIKLGQKDGKAASNIFSGACLLILGSGILLGTFIFMFAADFVRLMGADETVVAAAAQYLRVYALFSPFTTILFAVDNYLRICGKIRYSMYINILMSVLCVLFEFILLFLFRVGIWGASLATSISILICVIIAFMPFFRGKLQLRFMKPTFSREILMTILANGSPSFFSNIAGRITSVILNVFLIRMGGTAAVSAYGVLMYVDGMMLPVLYGLCDSLQPAVGYNWGAKRIDRVKALERRCFFVCGALSFLITAVVFGANRQLVGIFLKAEDVEVVALSTQALTLFAFAYLTRWFSFATQSYMSAVGKAQYAAAISLSIAFIFPVILIFSLSGLGLTGLWLNLPVSSLLCALLSIVILVRFQRKDVPRYLETEPLT
ncbi:MAG TPA: MATE family efflux transporter [Clostridiales bacterium]|nr:MATE family efflux transporter [Clostridiales bacterium]